MLREKYVFKLIPMLNPDGVKRGHYRTDSRGVNLNRVYLDPDPVLHPSIYAAKAVIMYHHSKGEQESENKVCTCKPRSNTMSNSVEKMDSEKQVEDDVDSTLASLTQCDLNDNNVAAELGERLPPDGMDDSPKATSSDDRMTIVSAESPDHDSNKNEVSTPVNPFPENNICEENTDSIDDKTTEQIGLNSTSKENSKSHSRVASDINDNINLCRCFSETHSNAKESPLEYYVDLHGHASKRGCFVYANYLENEDSYMQSILYPKLMSINSANFDFTGCNFTEKNMYTKDKRDGMSKEGSGRVAIFKATSIVHR